MSFYYLWLAYNVATKQLHHTWLPVIPLLQIFSMVLLLLLLIIFSMLMLFFHGATADHFLDAAGDAFLDATADAFFICYC